MTSLPSHATTLFTISKDEWDTKESIGKSMNNTLYIMRYAKGTSWTEVMSNSEVCSLELCLFGGISQLVVSRKFLGWLLGDFISWVMPTPCGYYYEPLLIQYYYIVWFFCPRKHCNKTHYFFCSKSVGKRMLRCFNFMFCDVS